MANSKSRSSRRPAKVAVVIMAAGKGTRLKSKHPKVLHEAGGKPLLAHVIAAAANVVPAKDIYVIIGHEAEHVRQAVQHTGVQFITQEQQLGTGHAISIAQQAIKSYDDVVILSGDAPLVAAATIETLRDFHSAHAAAMTILTAELPGPSGYGRILRKRPNSYEVKAIIEHKAATARQQKIREINSGMYAFAVPALLKHISKLRANNAQGEFYLTDMAALLTNAKQRVLALRADDANEVLGGNTRAELVEIDQRLRAAKCTQLMLAGTTIFYPDTCVIDSDVQVGTDTIIEPFVQLLGTTRIGSDCRIRSYSVIHNTEIGDGVTVLPGCVIDDARVENGAVLGPYSRLRPETKIGEGAHVGNFVEIKKSRLGKKSKANHLSYIGDSEIGEGVNIGAGTITCNYDGEHKHKTVIEDGVFVGSDSTLVAPVKVGKGAYIAAASCITDEVPQDSLAIGRARQIVKEGWVKQRRRSPNRRYPDRER
jgi:bifunctional UDP-N-acetylglucosamine pyrophosphorylase / glucosamine-1-phosphate N-acetyltransferase